MNAFINLVLLKNSIILDISESIMNITEQQSENSIQEIKKEYIKNYIFTELHSCKEWIQHILQNLINSKD